MPRIKELEDELKAENALIRKLVGISINLATIDNVDTLEL